MTSRALAIADRVAPSLLAHLWSSTLFLLLVLAALLIVRRHLTAGSRFALVLIGIAKFAIPSALIEPLLVRSASPTALQIPLQVVAGNFRITSGSIAPRLWPAIAIAVWLVLALALVLRQTTIRHRMVALLLRTAHAPRSREADALRRASRRLGIHRSIDIVRSAVPEAPAVLRVVRPVIVLPVDGCDDLTDGELESLLAHECAHVARHDNLIASIESLICAFFWFHPLIWIAQRITTIERERACDEIVADSAEARDTYLAALTKFCHAAIAPRLPGVSCMATAKLKERMDHVMKYPDLKTHAPSPSRVVLAAFAALVLFTIVSGIAGPRSAFAGTKDRYAVKVTATRTGESVVLQCAVSDNQSPKIVVAPEMTLDASRRATVRTSAAGLDIAFDVRPDSGDRIAVEVTIEKEGDLLQRNAIVISPADEATAASSLKYTGEPITLELKDADLHDVINVFGKLTGFEMKVDDSIHGTVSVSWQNVPWDQAFDSLLNDNGLTQRTEGKTIFVTKK